MIDIVGGCYNETCLSPSVRQFYGSAGRAAAALAQRFPKVVLHTFASSTSERKVRRLGAISRFDVEVHPAADEITFGYVHPLRCVQMLPPVERVRPAEPFHVEGKLILQFGTVEGTPTVAGGAVVYDPQNGVSPEGFRESGSSADRLAFVCNSGEAAVLTGCTDPAMAAQTLREREKAAVVVIKSGPGGAFVLHDEGTASFGAYRADAMFGIGSGDMFAAAFALFWGAEGMDAGSAADRASRAVSLYVGTRSERLASDAELDAVNRTVATVPGRVYLAGPFFTMAQRWLVEEARDSLVHMGLEVFSPLHDVGSGPADIVAPADLAGLESCDRVFAIIDGLDAGTLFEIGYARKLGLPVHAYAERLETENCKMISGSGCRVHRDFATAIYETAWRS